MGEPENAPRPDLIPFESIAELVVDVQSQAQNCSASPGRDAAQFDARRHSDRYAVGVHWVETNGAAPLSRGVQTPTCLLVVAGFLLVDGEVTQDLKPHAGMLLRGKSWSDGRCEGEFALIGIDLGAGEVVMATDGLGMHSIYIFRKAQRLVVGSSLALVMRLGGHDLSLDPQGMNEYLGLGFAGLRADSIYSGIELLPPATFRRYSWNGEITESVNYEESVRGSSRTPVTGHRLGQLLVRSCEQRAAVSAAYGAGVSCLPLTAGKDSILIAAALRRIGGDIEAWTYGNSASDDIEQAKRRAAALGLVHHGVNVESTVGRAELSRLFATFAIQSGGISSLGMLDLALFYEEINRRHGAALCAFWSGLGGELMRNYLGARDEFLSAYITDPLVLDLVAPGASVTGRALWQDLTDLFPEGKDLRPEEQFYISRRMPRKVGVRNGFSRRNVFQMNPLLAHAILPEILSAGPRERGDQLMLAVLTSLWPEADALWLPPAGRVANQSMKDRVFGLYRPALTELFTQVDRTPLAGFVSANALQRILIDDGRLPRVEWLLIRLAALVSFCVEFQEMSLPELKESLRSPLLPNACDYH